MARSLTVMSCKPMLLSAFSTFVKAKSKLSACCAAGLLFVTGISRAQDWAAGLFFVTGISHAQGSVKISGPAGTLQHEPNCPPTTHTRTHAHTAAYLSICQTVYFLAAAVLWMHVMVTDDAQNFLKPCWNLLHISYETHK